MSSGARFLSALFSNSNNVLLVRTVDTKIDITGRDLAILVDCFWSVLRELGTKEGAVVHSSLGNDLQSVLLLLTSLKYGLTVVAEEPVGNPTRQIKSGVASKETFTPVSVPLAMIRDAGPSSDALGSEIDDEHAFLVTYTSGSTGPRKGICHSARSLLECAESFNSRVGFGHDDRMLMVMPGHYMAGIFNCLIAPLQAGASVCLVERFSASIAMRFWSIIEREEVSSCWLSPAMLRMIMDLDRRSEKSPCALKKLFVGTGPLSADTARAFFNTYGIRPMQSYGLSELLYVSVDDFGGSRFGTVGSPLDGVKVSIAEDGKLVVDTEFAMLGYWGSSGMVKHSGPFVTSDVGHFDESGSIVIDGRLDDMIIRGGVNISPNEVEHALSTALSMEFCVVGLPHDVLGQEVVVVVEADDSLATEIEQKARTASELLGDRGKIDGVLCVSELPRSSSGKVLRSEVRKMVN